MAILQQKGAEKWHWDKRHWLRDPPKANFFTALDEVFDLTGPNEVCIANTWRWSLYSTTLGIQRNFQLLWTHWKTNKRRDGPTDSVSWLAIFRLTVAKVTLQIDLGCWDMGQTCKSINSMGWEARSHAVWCLQNLLVQIHPCPPGEFDVIPPKGTLLPNCAQKVQIDFVSRGAQRLITNLIPVGSDSSMPGNCLNPQAAKPEKTWNG